MLHFFAWTPHCHGGFVGLVIDGRAHLQELSGTQSYSKVHAGSAELLCKGGRVLLTIPHQTLTLCCAQQCTPQHSENPFKSAACAGGAQLVCEGGGGEGQGHKGHAADALGACLREGQTLPELAGECP